MKNGQIFARKSTARGRLDLEYLDETSTRKLSLREHNGMEQQIGSKLKHFTDYASKESLGQVHAGGFLHHLILVNEDGNNTAPAQLANAERKRRITEAWQHHLGKYPSQGKDPVIAHRMVFSMSQELHDKLTGAGINPDQVLHSTTKKMMEKFGERFHPKDSIGYAYGIHHDTDNLHIHVALCPRTKRGAYVGCSMSRSLEGRHKNQMTYLRSCFERENKRWEEMLSSPEKLREHLSKRLDADKITFAPRLARRDLQALQQTQTAEAIRLQRFYKSIRNLERAIATKKEALRQRRSSKDVLRLIGHRKSKLTQAMEKVSTALERRSIREMQQLLFKIKGNYRVAHKRYRQLYGFNSYVNRNATTQSHGYKNVL